MSRTKERKLRQQREEEEKTREQIHAVKGMKRTSNKKSTMPNRINMAGLKELEDRQDTVEGNVVYRGLPSLQNLRNKDP